MKKLFAIIIMCILSLPVFATDVREVEIPYAEKNNLEVLTSEEVNELSNKTVQEVDLSTLPKQLPSKFKTPTSKRSLVKKFMVAMLCVAGTSVLLYGSLSLYNKMRDGLNTQEPISSDGEQPLDTPNDLTVAVKTFIEKTNWE